MTPSKAAVVAAALLETLAGSAGTEIIPAEFLAELFAIDDPQPAADLRFTREALAAFAHDLESRVCRRCGGAWQDSWCRNDGGATSRTRLGFTRFFTVNLFAGPAVQPSIMDTTLLETKFHRLGARMKFVPHDRGSIRIDIRSDRRGEFFELASDGAAEVSVLDLQPQARHLLLLSRDGGAKHKYLCGHDERHWFVAGIPETAPVGTVRQAMDALKPPEVRVALARLGVRPDEGNRRKNAAFLRQGEWFFVPAPDLIVDPRLVLQREPLRRGNGKPHWAEFAYRTAGELVYVCRQFPNGVSQSRYQSLCSSRPGAKSWNWRPMRRNALVYVRGRIRHADHATILLPGWHRVLMNTEGQSQAMRNVAFLD